MGLRLSWGGGVFDTVRNPLNNLTTPRRRKKRNPAIYMLCVSHTAGPRTTGDSYSYLARTVVTRGYMATCMLPYMIDPTSILPVG